MPRVPGNGSDVAAVPNRPRETTRMPRASAAAAILWLPCSASPPRRRPGRKERTRWSRRRKRSPPPSAPRPAAARRPRRRRRRPAQAPAAGPPSVGPKRRDGYWEMSSHREDGSLRTTQYPVRGRRVGERASASGTSSRSSATAAARSWPAPAPAGPSTRAARCSASCTESKGTISGDFRDRFRVDLTVVEDGRRQAGSIRGEHKGACPAAFKPGDLVSDGRVLMNVLH